MFLVTLLVQRSSWARNCSLLESFSIFSPGDFELHGEGLWFLEDVTVIVLVCQGHHNKIPHTGWLKQQRCIFSKFWRLEVWDQGIDGVAFFWASLLAQYVASSFCVFTQSIFPWCVCQDSNFFFSQGYQPYGIKAHPNEFLSCYLVKDFFNLIIFLNFNLIILLKILSPNLVTCWGHMGCII